MALANRAAGARGKAGATLAEGVEDIKGDSATVWQAWQTAQDAQNPSATGRLSPAPWPAQSGAGVVADTSGETWSTCASAPVPWA